MKSPILVTGASGSLGRVLLRVFHEQRKPAAGWWNRHPLEMEGTTMRSVDLTDHRAVRDAWAGCVPRAVVHAAAATDVDWCEKNPERARAVNVEATERLARAAADAGAHFVYLSTDLVFDGERAPYGEEDAPNPLSHYGRSKRAGEEAALRAAPDAAVLRVALLYGWGSPQRGTFFDFLIRRLEAGESVRLFTDQFRTPALLEDVARVVSRVVEEKAGGLYHLGGAQRVSRYEFGRAACRAFGLPEAQLQPMRMKDFPFTGPRPADVSLRTDALHARLGTRMSTLAEGMARLRDQRRHPARSG